MSITFSEAILNALRQAAQYNRDDIVPPLLFYGRIRHVNGLILCLI